MIWALSRCCALVGAVLAGGAILDTGVVGASQWQWPLPEQPRLVRGFEPPTTPYGAGHRGVDLAGRPGVGVRAAGSGVVGYAGPLAGRGVVTVLHEGGLRTTYEPLVVTARPGERVTAGALLGGLAAGHAGCSVAACLHWGLLRGESYLDPLALLGVGRVRLLPLAASTPSAGHVTAAVLVTAAGALPIALWHGTRRTRTPHRGNHRRRRSRRGVSAARPSSRAAA